MPTGIYPRTEKHKKNISLALKGNANFKGHKHTEEYKQKMKLVMKERKKRDSYINSPATRKKIAQKLKGRKQSKESIKKRAEKNTKYHTEEELDIAKRKYGRIFYKKNKEQLKEIRKEWSKKYPEKVKAHNLARRYIKISKNQLCEICNEKIARIRHHKDYSKPLKVKFLCNRCHKLLHNRHSLMI